MRKCCRKLSWAVVLGVLAMPGAGTVTAQAFAVNSSVIQTTGPLGGSGGLSFLDIIGQGNPYYAANPNPSFSVVEFDSSQLGYFSVSQVSSVTISVTQSLFGAASRGTLAILITDDTTTSI